MNTSSAMAKRESWLRPWTWSLAARVLLAVVLGLLCGAALRPANWTHAPEAPAFLLRTLATLGPLVVRLLTLMASMLIFFAVADAFATTHITGRQGLKLILVCTLNVSFAFAIGLAIMNVWKPGEAWKGEVSHMVEQIRQNAPAAGRERDALSKALVAKNVLTDDDLKRAEAQSQSIDPLKFVDRSVPVSFLRPFVENQVLAIVLLGALVGLALRGYAAQAAAASSPAMLAPLVGELFRFCLYLLMAIVQWVPLAVFCIVTQVVAQFGVQVFAQLWQFLAAILAGLALHALVYYPLAVWVFSGRSPWTFLRAASDAVCTSLFTNSSLATVPITLRSLRDLGVSERSARLSACVATNFNNDGIALYEAMAAIFLAQALGLEPSLAAQFGILVAAVMAAVSITGIPEAGIIVLPLVLSAAGFDPSVVAAALVLLLPLDVIIARVRSGVNVLGDMTVAIMLDGRGRGNDE